jgi:hypothetical protein
LRRLAILLVAAVAAGTLTIAAAPPAAAISDCSSRTLPPGPHPPSREIGLIVCKGDVLIGDHSYFEYASLYIGSASTRATGCTLSFWTTLYAGGGSGQSWNGPSTFHDCRRTLRANASHGYYGRGSGTTARAMIVHSCLTLWYGGQRGQPICWESGLADV